MKFAAAQWAPSIGADATGGKLFSAEGMQNYNLLLITPPEGWYITHRTLITPPEGWYITHRTLITPPEGWYLTLRRDGNTHSGD